MNDRDYIIATATLWMEGRGLSLEDQYAIAHTLFNRLVSGKWFSKYKERATLALVCLKDQQFSCWNAAKDDSNREEWATAPDSDKELLACRAIIDSVYFGRHEDNTGGATHYYNPKLVKDKDGSPCVPLWAPGATFTVQRGPHLFFKDVK